MPLNLYAYYLKYIGIKIVIFLFIKIKNMKKSILFAFFFTLIMASSCSHTEIKEDQVPGAVVSAFKTKYPAATGTKWITEKEDGKTIYEAQFKENGDETKAEFNEDGSFVKEH